MAEKIYKVIIVGIGVSGASSLYMLTRYTNVGPIMVIEKYGSPAMVDLPHLTLITITDI